MNKKKILIVDDEVDFLKMVKLNLETTGKFETLILSNANDIIAQIHSFKPDLILLDMVMPGIGGIEVCEMLNQDVLGQRLPILILSALDKEKDKLLAFKKGVVGYLTKPIEKEELIAKIENALSFKTTE
ncbi:MAG TPA: response regulator [Candidatus Omnitrophota bacterium]|nr:response regulator [Candidatus Omnitrophota bacterium]HPT39148.1 response regulator [Candidatus Omnitrophota bacterium]